MAVGQNQWYHVGVGAPPILVYFSGDWDVHWEYGVLTHGHVAQPWSLSQLLEKLPRVFPEARVPYLDFAEDFVGVISRGEKRATTRCPGPKDGLVVRLSPKQVVGMCSFWFPAVCACLRPGSPRSVGQVRTRLCCGNSLSRQTEVQKWLHLTFRRVARQARREAA